MKIRKAKIKDSETISKIIKESIIATSRGFYTPEQIQEKINTLDLHWVKKYIKKNSYFICEIKGQIVGGITRKENHIRGLYIDPKQFSKGVGSLLMERIERDITDDGYGEASLWSTLYAVDFYKNLGYKRLKQVHLGELRTPLIEMSKSL
jgi:N-acetylglutamate synthase-like GNAT family acetyltransferase